MASRRLRNRSLSVVSQADSENVDVSDVTCFESDAEVTVRENPALEQAEQNANIVFRSNDNVIICTDSIVGKGSMSATQLLKLLSTLMQIIQSEMCKQTAALEAKLTAESLGSLLSQLSSLLSYFSRLVWDCSCTFLLS